MEHRIIVATGNEGKMREVRLILADLGIEIISMKELPAKLRKLAAALQKMPR